MTDELRLRVEGKAVSVTLRQVHIPSEADALSAFIKREEQWFEFVPAIDWSANGPEQWNYSAVVCGQLIGFGRLSYQSNLCAPCLVASYGVLEPFRRRGYGMAILRALDGLSDGMGLPLLAAVLHGNEPSLSLCRRYFGEHVWDGETGGGLQARVFGNARAKRVFTQSTEAVA